MSEHVTDQLSAYLDDELDGAARGAVETHLRTCAACMATLGGLRRVVSAAHVAPARDAAPVRDLWTGIAARIDTPQHVEVRTRVADFAAAAAAKPWGTRRVSLSIAQLAAAAALLIAVSGTVTWILRGNTDQGTFLPAAALIPVDIEPTVAPDSVRMANFADAEYDAAVGDLERALAERRNDLNPRTVEILERNLKLIDAAIAQARQALEEDPANTYLNRHLVESRRRKLELLRRATAITEAD